MESLSLKTKKTASSKMGDRWGINLGHLSLLCKREGHLLRVLGTRMKLESCEGGR